MSNYRRLGAVLAGVVLAGLGVFAVAPDADAANGLSPANGLSVAAVGPVLI